MQLTTTGRTPRRRWTRRTRAPHTTIELRIKLEDHYVLKLQSIVEANAEAYGLGTMSIEDLAAQIIRKELLALPKVVA